ncbi:hypothetical protein, partial [Methylobacterium iners]|uniref:hypothetical protein n=1 Tax=Methylobacterium iners TaxID=418707 RepID=UPI001EE31109
MATMHISPTGSGDRSGSSWQNAATLSSLDAMVQKAGSGGTVLLRADAGAYDISTRSINISHGGTEGRPVTIRGVDSAGRDMDAQFVGNRALDATAATQTGGQAFVLDRGAHDLTFLNLNIQNVSNAFRASGDVANIEIGHVSASNVQRFFEDRQANDARGVTATVSGLYIHDVDVTGYSKGFIRLQFDSHDVLIRNVVADSAGQNFDNFAMGAHIDGTAHDITFENVTIKNNQNFLGTYWNGDGFATEGGTYRITFIDTVSSGNTDAGYDLKSNQTTLIRAVADDNSRNFRIWGDDNVMIDSTGVDPHNRAGSYASQIWMASGAELTVTGSQFVDSGSMTRVFNFDGAASLRIADTTITHGGTLTYGSTKGLKGLSTDVVTKIAPTGSFSTNSVVVHESAQSAAPPDTTPPASPVFTLASGFEGGI